MYLLREGPGADRPRVQLLGSGAILREVLAAAELLRNDFHVESDVWSVTSFGELRRDGLAAERAALLRPDEARTPWVRACLGDRAGPVVAASDSMKAVADQIRAFVPQRYQVLGTDGYGRSDRREKLREFFEVSRFFIAVAALSALAEEGAVPREAVDRALERYKIDPEKPDPVTQ
jgi:pyruvate dehydrogenase E1 component